MTIKYILFDCDDTLVKTKDVAFEYTARIVCTILQSIGINQVYTPAILKAAFTDWTLYGIIGELQRRHHFRLYWKIRDRYIDQVDQYVCNQLSQHASPCDRVVQVLTKLVDENKYNLAVVSNTSSENRVLNSLSSSGLIRFFSRDRIFIGLDLPHSRPVHRPESLVYRHILQEYGVKPNECVAIEDTPVGARAAINARIPVMGYVGSYEPGAERHEAISALAMVGCKAILEDWEDFDRQWEFLRYQVERR
ncbi:hypothetical protein ABEF95_013360 [Exophiala dermatitidis]